MFNTDRARTGIALGAFFAVLGLTTIAWQASQTSLEIDPAVEQTCHKAVKKGAPYGYRGVSTYNYQKESSNLGVATGILEAQYAKGQWTQVAWVCRINPNNREIARVELSSASGGQKMRAAASTFQ